MEIAVAVFFAPVASSKARRSAATPIGKFLVTLHHFTVHEASRAAHASGGFGNWKRGERRLPD